MIRVLVALLAFALFLPGTAPAQPAEFGLYKPAPQFDEAETTSFYVPMRDGVRIAVSIHRPARGGKAAEGRFPVIWHNTLAIDPAGTGKPKAGLPELTRHGYVVAVVARRGNGASFGARRGYEDFTEHYDAYEMTEWLARQPWSNGRVGMYGCSNTGEAVMHALTMRPPSLKAAWAGCFSLDRYDGHLRGGIIAQFGTGPARTVEQDLQTTPVQGDEAKALLRRAAEEHLQSTNLFELMRTSPYRDSFSPLVMSRFWYEVSVGVKLDMVRQSGVPLYIQGGWLDDFRTQGFVTLANLPGQARMLIGPWRHCRFDGFDVVSEQLRFFDHHLKGIDTGIADDPPLHYWLADGQGGGSWTPAGAWPLPEAKPQVIRLAGKSFKVESEPSCPPDPQASGPAAGAFAVPCHPQGHGVVYTQPPLKGDLVLVGHPVADLWITADQPEANLFVHLEDVAPDGTVTVLAEGRQRASLRKLHAPPWNNLDLPWRRSWREDEQPLKAGAPVQVSFDLLAVAHTVPKGHRLQIAVTGSDARERARPEAAAKATVRIDPRSTVTLPVL